jgi:hypothetical protein
MKNFEFLYNFLRIYIPGSGAGAGAEVFLAWLRTPAKCCRSTGSGSGSATLFLAIGDFVRYFAHKFVNLGLKDWGLGGDWFKNLLWCVAIRLLFQ